MSEEIDGMMTAEPNTENSGMMTARDEGEDKRMMVKSSALNGNQKGVDGRELTTGRFTPGHSIKSPGRPPRRREERVLDIMEEEITDEDWRLIIDAAKRGAMQGHTKKLELLLAYGAGLPVQTVRQEESGLDWILAKLNGE